MNLSALRPDASCADAIRAEAIPTEAIPAHAPLQAGPAPAATAAQRVLEAELSGRSDDNDALSMMMSSMVRMVQAGQSHDSRWKAS